MSMPQPTGGQRGESYECASTLPWIFSAIIFEILVNGYFFIPTYGTLIAAVNFDRSGTTRIGKYVLNHSFMLPGLISTVTAVTTGLIISKLFF